MIYLICSHSVNYVYDQKEKKIPKEYKEKKMFIYVYLSFQTCKIKIPELKLLYFTIFWVYIRYIGNIKDKSKLNF